MIVLFQSKCVIYFKYLVYLLGNDLFQWLNERSNVIKSSMLKSVRAKAGLSSSDLRFTTNRVESINAVLKLEKGGKKMDVCDFVDMVQKSVERQQRNIKWTIIGNFFFFFQNLILLTSSFLLLYFEKSI